MCHRVTPLFLDELEDALRERDRTGHARLTSREVAKDCYPGRPLPLFVPSASGDLEAREFVWGFEGTVAGKKRLVFNTRLDTALRHRENQRGMWLRALESGRCLVPVRRFYESWTKNPPQRGTEIRFELLGHSVFLLAGICEDDRVSIVTTEPNRDVVSMHSRMPLVLGPGESSVWLGPDFPSLADRSRISLVSTVEVPSRKVSLQETLFDGQAIT